MTLRPLLARRLSRTAVLSLLVLLLAFSSIVLWFREIDFYHRHFFDRGIIVAIDNCARIGFVFILSWLITAPGLGVITLMMPARELRSLSLAERGVLGFGIGVGLWHATLLILGILGLYYRSVMIALGLLTLAASANYFGRFAIECWHSIWARFSELRQGGAILETIGILLILMAVAWILLVCGLYPGGNGDYYTHYFPYYLEVIKNHGLSPNDVWYHYYYSKGEGLFFLGILLTDPEAPALATFCCVAFAAVAVAALSARVAPRSLWPACAALLYLLYYLVSFRADGGEFQKAHEGVTALVVFVAWAICMERIIGGRLFLAMAMFSGIGAAIVTQAAGFMLAVFFTVLSGWSVVCRRWREVLGYGLAATAIGGTVIVVFVLNYVTTGLATDQALDLTLRFANFRRLDQWGVIPNLIAAAWIRDNYETPPYGWDTIYQLAQFMRLDVFWVFFIGIFFADWLAAHTLSTKSRVIAFPPCEQSIADSVPRRTMACLGLLVGTFIVISVFAGHSQHVSYLRFSSFFVPLLTLLGTAYCGWLLARSWPPWLDRMLRAVLPALLLIGVLGSWQATYDWAARAARSTANGLRFLYGRYS
jgi:hypothetical protein